MSVNHPESEVTLVEQVESDNDLVDDEVSVDLSEFFTLPDLPEKPKGKGGFACVLTSRENLEAIELKEKEQQEKEDLKRKNEKQKEKQIDLKGREKNWKGRPQNRSRTGGLQHVKGKTAVEQIEVIRISNKAHFFYVLMCIIRGRK